MRFKQLAVCAVVMVTLVVSSVATASSGFTGTYTTTIKSPAEIKGKWIMTFAKGVYTVRVDGGFRGRGHYSATGTTITLRESGETGCGGSGTYTWRKSGSTLRFVNKREARSCELRAVVLSHRFRQVR
jgi:hypothetical protein